MYPEQIKRMTSWMSARDLNSMVEGKLKAHALVEFDNQPALVEQRPSTKDEKGKYQYRLICLSSLQQWIESQDERAINRRNLSLSVELVWEKHLPFWSIRSVYTDELYAFYKSLSSVWDKHQRRTLVPWVFGDALFEGLAERFALGEEARMLSVTLNLAKLDSWTKHNAVTLFSKHICFFQPRTLKLGVDVVKKDKQLLATAPLVVVHNVPSTIYDLHKQQVINAVVDVQSTPEVLPKKALVKNICHFTWPKDFERQGTLRDQLRQVLNIYI